MDVIRDLNNRVADLDRLVRYLLRIDPPASGLVYPMDPTKFLDGNGDFNQVDPSDLTGINLLAGKTTPVDADVLLVEDSAASYTKKKLIWSNIKATLKTYFDSIYNTVITQGTGGGFDADKVDSYHANATGPASAVVPATDANGIVYSQGLQIQTDQDNSNSTFYIQRPYGQAAVRGVGMLLRLYNSTPTMTNYGGIAAYSQTPTAGSEVGRLALRCMAAGTLEEVISIWGKKVGIMNTAPTYDLDVTGVIASTKGSMLGGTSFPASPTTGQQFFRTDLGWLCYWNGTYWLTAHEYEAPWMTGQSFAATGGSTDVHPLRTDYRFWVTRYSFRVNANAPQDGSNYYTIALRSINATFTAAAAYTTFSTAALTTGAWNVVEAAVGATHATYIYWLDWTANKVGSPGNILVVGTIYYRLIVT